SVVGEAAGSAAVRVRVDGGRLEEVLCEIDLDGARYTLSRVRAAPPAGGLSPREREIAALVAQGLPTKAIAAALCISGWTVCTHLRRVYARWGVGTRAAAARGTFGGTASARSEEPVIGLSRIRDSATPCFRQCSFWSRTPGTSQYHAAKRANDRIGGSDARMDVTIRSGAASPLPVRSCHRASTAAPSCRARSIVIILASPSGRNTSHRRLGRGMPNMFSMALAMPVAAPVPLLNHPINWPSDSGSLPAASASR